MADISSSLTASLQRTTSQTNEQRLRSLLDELTFWEPSSTPSTEAEAPAAPAPGESQRRPRLISTNHSQLQVTLDQPSNTTDECSIQQQHTTECSSPTLSELEAANTWHKAVDPASGRTYYYDSITRQTQWEKVCSVIVVSYSFNEFYFFMKSHLV